MIDQKPTVPGPVRTTNHSMSKLKGARLFTPVDIEVPSPFLLYGVVTDVYGDAVGGATVQVIISPETIELLSGKVDPDNYEHTTTNQMQVKRLIGEVLTATDGSYKVLLPHY